MHIVYITSYRLPTEKAHGRQVANMANAMIDLGHTVTIVAPNRKNTINQSFHEYYDVSSKIHVEYLPVIDWLDYTYIPKMIAFYLTHAEYVHRVKKYLAQSVYDYVITREFYLTNTVKSGDKIIVELHSIPKTGVKIFTRYCKNAYKIVCLTKSMANDIHRLTKHKNISIEPDAVEIQNYNILNAQTARQELGIQTNRHIVCYTGKLKTMGMDKGVHDLLYAIKILQPQKKFFCLIVGGPEKDKEEYIRIAKALELQNDDIEFTGDVPFASVHKYLAASDILTMPWPDVPHYRHYMSPLKMFEYMAAKKPILTGDLPTIRDILSEETATFCTPNSPESIAKCLEEIVADYSGAMQKAEHAHTLVEQYTWKKRVERIFDSN